jgi:hypothetical protein
MNEWKEKKIINLFFIIYRRKKNAYDTLFVCGGVLNGIFY